MRLLSVASADGMRCQLWTAKKCQSKAVAKKFLCLLKNRHENNNKQPQSANIPFAERDEAKSSRPNQCTGTVVPTCCVQHHTKRGKFSYFVYAASVAVAVGVSKWVSKCVRVCVCVSCGEKHEHKTKITNRKRIIILPFCMKRFFNFNFIFMSVLFGVIFCF